MDESYDLFLQTVDARFLGFINEINDYLLKQGCKCDIKTAKSGYVVSYVYGDTKKTLANFVSRKTGMKIRIYAEHVTDYQDFLDTLPDKMKKEIQKASVCKRLLNPADCNSRCPMGYTFELGGELYKKCRYMAFMPTLSAENNPFIQQFLQHEIALHG